MKSCTDCRRWTVFLLASVIIGIGNFFIIGFNPSPELKVVAGFIALVIQFGLTALLGGLLGVLLGLTSQKYVKNTKAIANVARIGFSSAVFAMWVVPFVSTLGALAVTAAACHYYLASKSFLFLDAKRAKSLVIRETVLDALLVTLLVQVLDPHGFGWFMISDSYGLLKVSSAFILVVLTLYLLGATTSFAFVNIEINANVPSDILSRNSHASVTRMLIFAAVFVIAWQILNLLGLGPWISSPWSILHVAILLISGQSPDYSLGGDIVFSVGEICLGLVLCGGMTLCLCKVLSTGGAIQESVWKCIYFTRITPILFVPLLVQWGVVRGFWSVTVCVALLAFFPFIKVLGGLGHYSVKFKVLLASLEALPYAFVAMLFGETINSFAGIGFALVAARNNSGGGPTQPIVLLLTTILLFGVLSSLLRCLARLVSHSANI